MSRGKKSNSVKMGTVNNKGISSSKGEIDAKVIKQTASALYSSNEIRLGLDQLRRRKVIVATKDQFTFKLNTARDDDKQYIDQLLSSLQGS